jgi:hypothetical protein
MECPRRPAGIEFALLAGPFDAVSLDHDLDDGKWSDPVEFVRPVPAQCRTPSTNG